jgi:deoxycytidylate deaminase
MESAIPSVRPELVIGLVGPIGTDLNRLSDELARRFKSMASYEATTIKLSQLLQTWMPKEQPPQDARAVDFAKWKMDLGDKARKKYGAHAVAGFAIQEIRSIRYEHNTPTDSDSSLREMTVVFQSSVSKKVIKSLPGFSHLFRDEESKTAIFNVSMPSKRLLRELARLPVLDIWFRDTLDPQDVPLDSHAYILNSLKHPAEVRTLRRVYGSRFILVGCYATEEQRQERLSRKLADSESQFSSRRFSPEAGDLMRRDEDDLSRPHGQKTQDTFWKADFFVAEHLDGTSIADQVNRFVGLIFGDPLVTPQKHEVGMMLAFTTARRSGALSRQVGAAIIRPDGTVAATGCNEVPKAGGGQYWEEDTFRDRDLDRKKDVSDELRFFLLNDFLTRLGQSGWIKKSRLKSLDEERSDDDRVASFVSQILEARSEQDSDKPRDASRILALIEYTRTVHAEMAAITDAVRHGVSIEGCELFTTTFPCHECTRHIIASGITKVTYIAPYQKSLAWVLNDTSISLPNQCNDKKVEFAPFYGVSEKRYFRIFDFRARKGRRGVLEEPDLHSAMPDVLESDKDATSSTEAEILVLEELKKLL